MAPSSCNKSCEQIMLLWQKLGVTSMIYGKQRPNQGSTCTANCVIADILSVGIELGVL